jgi:chromate transporter
MHRQGSVTEVFTAFLKLGVTAFGGPVAHIGYFRQAFVSQRRWLDDAEFAHLLALCQFLPGPASSQMGFSLGLLRAGWGGALAAFIAFTLPSAALLVLFAASLSWFSGELADAVIHGLKLVAVAVVAQAVWQMTRTLTPDWPRRVIALLALVVLLLSSTPFSTLLVVALGAVSGLLICRQTALVSSSLALSYGKGVAWSLLALFLLLLGLSLIPDKPDSLAVFEAFYQTGAMVFGGGHVVLPLLEQQVVAPGWVSHQHFLAGYGAAQAVPGPLFSLSAYLGMLIPGDAGGLSGAGIALVAIFLPGMLLVSAMLPLWQSLLKSSHAANAVAGANAAIVGLLAAALYDPLWTSAIMTTVDLLIALSAFVFLQFMRLSALIAVIWCVFATTIYSIL